MHITLTPHRVLLLHPHAFTLGHTNGCDHHTHQKLTSCCSQGYKFIYRNSSTKLGRTAHSLGNSVNREHLSRSPSHHPSMEPPYEIPCCRSVILIQPAHIAYIRRLRGVSGTRCSAPPFFLSPFRSFFLQQTLTSIRAYLHACRDAPPRGDAVTQGLLMTMPLSLSVSSNSGEELCWFGAITLLFHILRL